MRPIYKAPVIKPVTPSTNNAPAPTPTPAPSTANASSASNANNNLPFLMTTLRPGSKPASEEKPTWKPAQLLAKDPKAPGLIGQRPVHKPVFSPGDKGQVSDGGKVPGSGTSDPGKGPTTTGDQDGIRRRPNQFEWQKNHDYNAAYLIDHNKQVQKADANVTQGRVFGPDERGYMHVTRETVVVKPEGAEVTNGKEEKIRMFQPDANGYMSTVKD